VRRADALFLLDRLRFHSRLFNSRALSTFLLQPCSRPVLHKPDRGGAGVFAGNLKQESLTVGRHIILGALRHCIRHIGPETQARAWGESLNGQRQIASLSTFDRLACAPHDCFRIVAHRRQVSHLPPPSRLQFPV
jgi:hypothetical protein